ncbi:MAG TPA: hypothetical protein VE010_09955, partial [Thermoanaerobaculia bacterium]|nr:hypothetical protein [Thermoanaerobaculia bacterium]
YFLDGADHNMMRGIGSSLNIYFTRSPAPEVDLVALVNRTARCYSEEYGHEIDCLDLDGGILYLNEQKVLADLDVFPIISPMAHQVPPGQPVTFGTGPGWPRGHFDAVPGAWGAQITWFGTLGEFLFPEIRSARLSVRDAAGTIVGEGGALVLKEETLPPGRYRVESTSPTRLAPMTGRASYAGEVDTTKAETMLPVFTGMRVVDEANQPVAVVAPDSAATLLLSGADQIKMPTGGILRVPIREEMTRVEYRAHGSSEWRPLAPVVTARHYTRRFPLRGGVGTMFRVDLSTVTGQIAGAVDLRMQIEDAAGNTAQVTLEPAFIVAPATRRRSARH